MVPDSPGFEEVTRRFGAGVSVLTCAPAILEVTYGWSRRGDARAMSTLRALLLAVQAGGIEVVPMGHHAAVLAGRLRAAAPVPPPRSRSDRRPKPERRAAWLLDMQIAACAHVAGHAVATFDRADFERIGTSIGELTPGGPRFEVVHPEEA